MLKNKLDYKLVNIALIALIVFLLYMTGNLWIGIMHKILTIVLPFLFAFAIAYALYPFLEKMVNKKIPKWLGITIIVFAILSIAALVIYLVATVLIGQLSSLFNNVLEFISSLQKSDFDFNLVGIESTLSDTFKTILNNVGKYVSD